MKKTVLAAFLIMVPLVCLAEPLRMGISSRVPNTNEEFLQTTIQTLKNKFGPDNVKVTYYSLKGLEEAVKAGQVDFMQSSAGMYRRLLPEGVRDLVALSSPRYP
ncbi:hypothetical protein, partial [Turicimonas muris]